MNAGMVAMLMENLKVLKLSAMKRDLESYLRQAKHYNDSACHPL